MAGVVKLARDISDSLNIAHYVRCELAVVRCLMDLFHWQNDQMTNCESPYSFIRSLGRLAKSIRQRTTANSHRTLLTRGMLLERHLFLMLNGAGV
jgi:hypothetical protein